MPFAFSEISTLLSRLEDIELHDPPILRVADKSAQAKAVIESWFKSHRREVNGLNIDGAVALLSALLPERRTDRVYGIQSPRLCRILGRCIGLRATRAKELEAYKQPGKGDLALCLERVLKDDGPPARPPATLEDVDEMFDILAGNCRFSDRSKRLPSGSSKARDEVLGNIFKRLDATQAKWLVRLILKDLSPVRLDETLVLQSFHFLLPDLLRFQDDLDAAIRLLRGPLREFPENPDPRSRREYRQGAAALLKPAMGVKVGRPNFHKARSIDNCINMCGSNPWILERKYDGEYCEIHINMARSQKPAECITIFSKSGKTSTEDRQGLHRTLIDCLKLGRPECKIKRQAIILGELVVYSEKERRVLPFENIRKYVSRSGVSLGTDEDSQPHAYEHLAIVFFDLLLLDDEIVIRRPLKERRTSLRKVYTKIGGRAMGAEWKIVPFNNPEYARNVLIQQFAASVAERCEGLVLKPASIPYFPLNSNETNHVNGYIKLKADYIAGMGDEADFAVVAGSYNSQQALRSSIPNLKWTDFHLGCLLNKHDVLRFAARPRFKVVGTIQADQCIPKPILEAVNVAGVFSANPYSPIQPPAKFDVECAQSLKIDVTFDDPFVFEVLGSGFEKPSNCNFLMLRHSRVKKLHQDRTWRDCISMEELQKQAKTARAAPADSESQETRRLIERLESKCRKKIERQRAGTPSSRAETTPPTSDRQLAATTTLDGTTLINEASCGSKRPRDQSDETPCPAPKKHRVDEVNAAMSKGTQPANQPRKLGRESSPLSDITNTAPLPCSAGMPVRAPASSSVSSEILHKPSGAPFLHSEAKDPSTKDLYVASKSPPLRARDPASCLCTSPTCPFTSSPTVIYPTPCIAHTPYIICDLLRARHPDILIVPTLAHWDRDSLSPAHPPLSEIVGESQAFEGRRKIMVVEARRVKSVGEVVREILGLNGGCWRERVEVWDWRVLEECVGDLLRSGSDGRGGVERYLVGVIGFDAERQGGIYVGNHVGSFMGDGSVSVGLE